METYLENFLYIYWVRKEHISSDFIAQAIKTIADYDIKDKPDFIKEKDNPYYIAVVRINDTQEKFLEIAKAMGYFEINGNSFQSGPKLLESPCQHQTTLFVNNLDRNMTSQKLEDILRQSLDGDYAASVYVSKNPENLSTICGIVSFHNQQTVDYVLTMDRFGNEEFDFHILPFRSKYYIEYKETFNTICIQNFPSKWNKENIEKIFGQYGTINSTIIMTDKNQGAEQEARQAFVTYEEDPNDRENDQKCFQFLNAVTQENDKEYDGIKLIVKQDLSNSLIEQRCYIYVKNFPENTTEEQLKAYFEKYGDIESIKLNHKEDSTIYAIVCFKSPYSAGHAKNESQTETFNGKQLFINSYKQKDVRKKQQEDVRDRTDFANLRKQSPASALNIDIQNRPETFQFLQHLMLTIQKQQQNQRFNDPQRYGGNMRQRGPRQPYNNQGAYQQRNQQLPQGQIPSQMSHPNGQPQQPPQGIPLSSVAPSQTIQHLPPYIFAYNQTGINKILPLVTISNPNYKYQVGEHIYEHVESLAGEDLTPKITGMLIDLPIAEIQAYVTDFTKLQIKINEAYILLKSSQYKIE
eukprot:403343134